MGSIARPCERLRMSFTALSVAFLVELVHNSPAAKSRKAPGVAYTGKR
jgi:hypothetical protein